MSIPARSKRKDGNTKTADTQDNQNTQGIRDVIDNVKNNDNQGDTETAKNTHDMLNLLKTYFKKSTKKEEDSSEATVSGGPNKICKVYGCIYQGTYNGIIDGLKALRASDESDRAEKIKKEDTQKLLKETAKLSYKVPITIGKAVAGLLDFRKSEILNLVEAIRYGGKWKGKSVDYSQNAWKIIASEGKERKKAAKRLKSASAATTPTELLEKIYDTLTLTTERSFFKKKKTENQITILKDIRSGVGGQKDNFLGAWKMPFKFMMSDSRYRMQHLEDISANTAKLTSGGLFGFWKKKESESEILKDIRINTTPREKAQKTFWEKLNTPIFSLFKKDAKAGFDERTAIATENMSSSLEKNNAEFEKEYFDNIIDNLKEIQDNTWQSQNSLNILDTKRKDLIHSPYERRDLAQSGKLINTNKKQLIETRKLCDCFGNKNERNFDDEHDIMKKTEKNDREKDISKEERVKDNTRRQLTFFDAIKNLGSSDKELALMPDVVKKVVNGLETVSLTDSSIKKLNTEGDSDKEKDNLLPVIMNKVVDNLENLYDISKQHRKDDIEENLYEKERAKDIERRQSTFIDAIKNYGPKGKDSLKGKGKGKDNLLSSITKALAPELIAKLLAPIITSAAGLISVSLATSIAGVLGAGVGGYAAGTLINKGINKTIETLSRGKSSSLGESFYIATHFKEIKKQKAIEEETKKKMSKIRKRWALEKQEKMILENQSKTATGTDNIFSEKGQKVLVAGMAGATIIADKTENLVHEMTKPGGLLEETTNLAKTMKESVVNKTKELNIQEKASQLNERMVSAYEKGAKITGEALSENKGIIDEIKNSKTAQALKTVVTDVSTTIGGSTTNITLPVSAHDTDKGNNQLVHSLGA